jgi:hypothetical protein
MKLRTLTFGVAAKSDSITNLPTFFDPISISDYDAFIFDPNAFAGHSFGTGDLLNRRQVEIKELVERKGGIVVCVLRPSHQVNFGTGGAATAYNLLDGIAPKVKAWIPAIRPGEGSGIKLVPSANGVLSGYLRVLHDKIRFTAYFSVNPEVAANCDGTVLAVNSVNYPLAIEFSATPGRLCFVPSAFGVDDQRLGAAFQKIVDAHFGGPIEIEAPIWAKSVEVPGSTAHDARLAELEEVCARTTKEISVLTTKRLSLLSYRQLLFGYGTSILEPVVRAAFKQLGFDVPEQNTYAGEWDVELHDPLSASTAIGEVEGSAGIIDVDKYRQLLDYYQKEVLEGRKHKGILIGNGYRQTELNSPERQRQFSEHALNGATVNGFCLLPTTELFQAVCKVLEYPANEARKIEIRESILSTVGVWKWIPA